MIDKKRCSSLALTALAAQSRILRLIAFGVLAAVLMPVGAGAEFYSFEDKNGSMHFVEDLSKIPQEYRKKKQVRKDKYDDLSEEDRALKLAQEREERDAARSRETEQQRQARLESERLAAKKKRDAALTTAVIISNLQVFVPVKLANGSTVTEATLLLDTGANTTLITPEVAARLNIEGSESARVKVVGGRVLAARTAVLSQVRVGPVWRENQKIVIVSQRGGGIGDGLLGMDFLAGLKYTIDFEKQTINWLP
jgi:predicted aspartyl protease